MSHKTPRSAKNYPQVSIGTSTVKKYYKYQKNKLQNPKVQKLPNFPKEYKKTQKEPKTTNK